MQEDSTRGRRSDAEFALWHVYDAGGSVLRLKVRYREGRELPNWREGPDLVTALEQAAAEGWHAYDREPGGAPGEYAIYHLKRVAASSGCMRTGA